MQKQVKNLSCSRKKIQLVKERVIISEAKRKKAPKIAMLLKTRFLLKHC